MVRVGVGVAMLLAVVPLGLPFENTWFSGFVAGFTCFGFCVAGIMAMQEPTEHSSPAYIWFFRFSHSMFHLGTSYFAHPSVWKYFKDPRGDRRKDRTDEE